MSFNLDAKGQQAWGQACINVHTGTVINTIAKA